MAKEYEIRISNIRGGAAAFSPFAEYDKLNRGQIEDIAGILEKEIHRIGVHGLIKVI
jgi:hypothetical protein